MCDTFCNQFSDSPDVWLMLFFVLERDDVMFRLASLYLMGVKKMMIVLNVTLMLFERFRGILLLIRYK